MEQQARGVSAGREGEELDRETEARARVIRAEIDQTREELTETVEAIQERLRPGNVMSSAAAATTEKVKNMAYNAADRAEEWMDRSGTGGFVDRVTSNPVPLALTIVGATWLMAGNGKRARRDYSRDYSHRAYSSGDYPSRDYSSHEGSREYSSRDYGVRGSGSRTTRSTDSIGDMMQRGGRRVQSMFREYPVAVGAAALIVGAALGMAVPETEKENELMGEARDTAMERAQEAASSAVGKVKDATADVVTRTALGE